jgi:hypothetical protein
MMRAAERTRQYGSNSVYSEVARQETGDIVGPTRTPRSGLRRFALELVRRCLRPIRRRKRCSGTWRCQPRSIALSRTKSIAP